jgi:hypothetical protein
MLMMRKFIYMWLMIMIGQKVGKSVDQNFGPDCGIDKDADINFFYRSTVGESPTV